MKKFYAKAIINAPAKVVWATITDPKAHPKFDPNCIDIEGTIAKDQRIKIKTCDSNKIHNFKVSTFNPNEIMIWESTLPLMLLKNALIFNLIAKDDQTTEFHVVETFGGILPKIFNKMVPDASASVSTLAKGLKRFIESRP